MSVRKGLGLKSALNEAHLQNRLQYRPEVLELHLTEDDVFESHRITEWIDRLREQVPKLVLHHPSSYKGQYLDIISTEIDRREFYDHSTQRLLEICRSEQVKLVIHAHYLDTESADWTDARKVDEVKQRIEHFQREGAEYLLWENSTTGIFSSKNPAWIREIVRPLGLRLCVDISHLFIATEGDNAALVDLLYQAQPYGEYYHVVDSQGDRHDGLELGRGQIDWQRVVPFVYDKDVIFEIDLRESGYADCVPMIRSFEYFQAAKARLRQPRALSSDDQD